MNARPIILSLFMAFVFISNAQDSFVDSNTDSGVFYKNIFKVNLFPMIGGRLNLAWEGGTKKMPGFEVSLEGIGLFAKDQDKPKGFTGQLGYRKYIHKYSEEALHPNSAFFIQPALKIGYAAYYEYLTLYDPLGNIITSNKITSFYFNIRLYYFQKRNSATAFSVPVVNYISGMTDSAFVPFNS